MTLFKLCFFIVMALPFLSAASLFEQGFEPASGFYKTPESPFVSGYASKNELLSQTRQSYTDFSFEALVGKKSVSVQNDQVLKEMDVAWKAEVKKATPLYLFQDLTSSHQAQLKEDQMIEIENIQGPWARVQLSALKKGYVLTSSLKIHPRDPGVWTNLAPAILLKEARENSNRVLTLPALSRLQLVKIEKEFGLFKTQSYSGYIALRDLVGRVDFASLGWAENKWQKIMYRSGVDVVVFPNKKIPLSTFTAFKEDHNRALISGNHPSLSKGTRIELIRPVATRWTQSEIKGHGLVWWKRDLLKEDAVVEEIKTSELLKKNLKGLSYDSKTKKGLASAGGIYKTTDGKTWKKLSFFGNDDWPVLIHPDGVWFVGQFRSTNEGKSFDPTMKWNEIARLLQTENKNKAFIHLKVLDLIPLPKSQVALKIDTGVTIAKLRAHVLSNNWILQN